MLQSDTAPGDDSPISESFFFSPDCFFFPTPSSLEVHSFSDEDRVFPPEHDTCDTEEPPLMVVRRFSLSSYRDTSAWLSLFQVCWTEGASSPLAVSCR